MTITPLWDTSYVNFVSIWGFNAAWDGHSSMLSILVHSDALAGGAIFVRRLLQSSSRMARAHVAPTRSPGAPSYQR